MLSAAFATFLVTGSRRAAADTPTVVVAPGDAQDLYDKLADARYAGHTLLLSGTYVLTAAGSGAATAGYLELGDRHLRGTNVMETDGDGIALRVVGAGDPSRETVVDGSALAPAPEAVDVSDGFPAFTRARALIRAPFGNSIEGITVKWPVVGFGPGGAIRIVGGRGARVASCRIESRAIGIFVSNAGRSAEHTVLGAEIVDTVVARRGVAPGILVTNLLTRDAHVEVDIGSTRIEGGAPDTTHLVMHNQNAMRSSVAVASTRNRFTGPLTIGVIASGCNASVAPSLAASGNRTTWTSFQDIFERNAIGVFGRGAFANGVDNDATVRLEEPTFDGNAITMDLAGREGIGDRNVLHLLVRRASFVSGGPLLAIEELGPVAGADNTVSVFGNATSWEQTNPGLPAPADGTDPDHPDARFFTGN